MATDVKFWIYVVQIIYILIVAAFIALVSLVYSTTSNNPLEQLDKDYPNLINRTLLEENPPFQLYNDEEKYCQCGDKILGNICTEEQIITGCYDTSKYKENALIRNLDDYHCQDLNNKLISTRKFAEVFDIGYGTVHKMALGILICECVFEAVNIIVSLLSYCSQKTVKACNTVFTCIVELAGIANFVLVIILLVNFYKGTTTGEFLDFYDYCSESKIYKDNTEFNEAYEILSKAYTYMTAWIILAFSSTGLGCFIICFTMFCLGKMSSR